MVPQTPFRGFLPSFKWLININNLYLWVAAVGTLPTSTADFKDHLAFSPVKLRWRSGLKILQFSGSLMLAIFRRTHYLPIHFKCQKRRQCSWLNQIIACYRKNFFLNVKSYTLFTNGDRNGKAHNTIALLKVSFGKSYSILLSQWDSSRCNFIGQCWLVLRSKGWPDKQSTALHRMKSSFLHVEMWF